MTKEQLDARQKVYLDQLAVAQQVAAGHQQKMAEAQQQILQLQGALADIAFWLSKLDEDAAVCASKTDCF